MLSLTDQVRITVIRNTEQNTPHTEPGICLPVTPDGSRCHHHQPSTAGDILQVVDRNYDKDVMSDGELENATPCILIFDVSFPGYFVPTSSKYFTMKETNLCLIMNLSSL